MPSCRIRFDHDWHVEHIASPFDMQTCPLYQQRLENAIDPAPHSSALSPQHSALLLARPPVAQEEGEVGGADDVISVEVGGVVGVRAPMAQENG